MTTLRVHQGDKVIVYGDPLVHIVFWENYRSWDSNCGMVVEDYQPGYYFELLDIDEEAMSNRLGVEPEPYRNNHPALKLQVAPDDAIVTCILCWVTTWPGPLDQRDVFDDVDE